MRRNDRGEREPEGTHCAPSATPALTGSARGTLTAAEINAAYRTKVKKLHPDTGGGGDSDMMTALQGARDTLLAQIT